MAATLELRKGHAPRLFLAEIALQCGRNFRVAEGWQRRACKGTEAGLQCGRNFRVAEGVDGRPPAERVAGFNVAATLELRKGGIDPDTQSLLDASMWPQL